MAHARTLDVKTLDAAALNLAGQWFLPTRYSHEDSKRPVLGKGWVLNTFYDATFKDEHDYLKAKFRMQLGFDALKEFDKTAAGMFTPRDETLFEQLLAEKLAINPSGKHIKGKVGTTNVGSRVIGVHPIEVETRASIRHRKIHGLSKAEHRVTELKMVPNKVQIFAGEVEENGHTDIGDFIRDMSGALAMNVSAEIAILGLDALVDGLDEGAGSAVLEGRSGAQPVDPDAAVSGTLGFTLVCSAVAFGAAADQADGTIDAAAAAISDDTSAAATITLGYIRASSTTNSLTPIDDHIDGEAGVSGADFNFNTLAIVSGATVSMTSWVITLDQGTTAT